MKPPKLRCKTIKGISYAVCRIKGKDHYLGHHGTPESKQAYCRLIREYMIGAPVNGSEAFTVDAAIVAYLNHAAEYYIKDGKPTSEIHSVRRGCQLLHDHYGDTPAADFGPQQFTALRSQLVEQGLVIKTVNHYCLHIIKVFRLAASHGNIAGAIYQNLQSVEPLRPGRCGAKPSRRIEAISQNHLDAVLPHLSSTVADMVRLQSLTGMRPGEVCTLRPCDVHTDGGICAYRPGSHKTQHHGRERAVVLGPSAQNIVAAYIIGRDHDEFCFSPREAVQESRRRRSEARTTPINCGNARGTNRKHGRKKRQPGACYTATSYRRAIQRACDAAKVPRFAPNQIRKLAAVRVRDQFGLEAAQAVLGHASKTTTERAYAPSDLRLAVEVADKIG